MRLAKIIKILIPVLLLATTFFPIYAPNSAVRAVSIYGLLLELPLAFIVPVLFAGSVLFAYFDTKWSSVQSAVLAVLGIIAAFVVNEFTNASVATPEPYTSIAIVAYVLVTPFAYLCFLIRRIFRRRRKPAEAEPKHVAFLTMPIWRYVLFMALSCGTYHLYWHYVNWKAAKTREGSAIWPFWRTAFFVFWIYPLFKRIIAGAQKHKHQTRFGAGLLAGLYITIYFASVPLSFWLTYRQLWIASLVTLTIFILLTIPVQQAANAESPIKKTYDKSPNLAEAVILLFGMLIFVTNSLALMNKPNITIPEDIRIRMSLAEQSFQLSLQYATCSEDLNERFAQLDENDPAAVDAYDASYGECEAVKQQLDRVIEKLERGF